MVDGKDVGQDHDAHRDIEREEGPYHLQIHVFVSSYFMICNQGKYTKIIVLLSGFVFILVNNNDQQK